MKIKQRKELVELIRQHKKAGQRVIMANGCFDLVHGGHVSYLQDSKKLGDILVVAVNSDSSIKKLKGDKRPIYLENERLEILAAFECIDYIMVFDEPTVDGILRELHPDVHSKGTDYTKETVPERQTAIEMGIETYIAGAPKENATKDIIQLILERWK
ncbi:MAG TPA: adenylyltransferase/cytidyltransferase family protein [Candidatus Sumerlaeota bacterium]|nr:MAG: Bifunctional protein HldE [candidate division BRC1 bacterium ADurb.Bin183]HOE64535.1 adenylyltransferase/cytidyltransferase family protein [Candidatus Sumerlaeota bacterium]HRR31884.1 adenylyltransferase/cytidyltransferase family protein [Candidatus Sumerlaeia bacterium]HON49710.1 adenylyltransferase/cytidyltransferase family protein [Candidatus Sumerlaeota bacterium]HOR64042.1 adenylyltransferase/cytidyltransferase family protein [Candidatus Sumerlaeota bacterium]